VKSGEEKEQISKHKRDKHQFIATNRSRVGHSRFDKGAWMNGIVAKLAEATNADKR